MAIHKRQQPSTNNALFTGGVLIVLVLIGIWIFMTPEQKLAQTEPAAHLIVNKDSLTSNFDTPVGGPAGNGKEGDTAAVGTADRQSQPGSTVGGTGAEGSSVDAGAEEGGQKAAADAADEATPGEEKRAVTEGGAVLETAADGEERKDFGTLGAAGEPKGAEPEEKATEPGDTAAPDPGAGGIVGAAAVSRGAEEPEGAAAASKEEPKEAAAEEAGSEPEGDSEAAATEPAGPPAAQQDAAGGAAGATAAAAAAGGVADSLAAELKQDDRGVPPGEGEGPVDGQVAAPRAKGGMVRGSTVAAKEDGSPAAGSLSAEEDATLAPMASRSEDKVGAPAEAVQGEEAEAAPLPAISQPAEVAKSAELATEAETKAVTQLDSQAQESTAEKEFAGGANEAVTEAAPAAAAAPQPLVAAAAQRNYSFPLCEEGMVDYIPCLDNMKAIKALRTTAHYEHRERHCPPAEELPRCLVPLPKGYKLPIQWPKSRDRIWYSNVPHPQLVSYKKDQNWVRQEGDEFVFPGGGTQFKHGAKGYIDFIQETVPEIAWGRRVRTALDMGCGVASWGAALAAYNVTVTSMAPKDEHEAQVQLALERGIPALLGVMGTQRQPFPANSFDLIQCSRCRVPWHLDGKPDPHNKNNKGGKLLIELNRLMRPGGYFVWSATPVYQNSPEDVQIWNDVKNLAGWMCWKQVAKKNRGHIGIAVWQKPVTNACYRARPRGTAPAMCPPDDNPDAAWYVPMKACIHYVPEEPTVRGGSWPAQGPQRQLAPPPWLEGPGMFGPGPLQKEFGADTRHWRRVFARSYANGLGIAWKGVRNVMDANAHYGGFAVVIMSARPVWVMSAVPTASPDTLPIIQERGLIGVYHDWCEAFNTYPRTYDLVHMDHLLHQAAGRCDLADVLLEMDRILRPKGWVIIREGVALMEAVKPIAAAFHWELKFNYSEGAEALVAYQKDLWRPAPAALS